MLQLVMLSIFFLKWSNSRSHASLGSASLKRTQHTSEKLLFFEQGYLLLIIINLFAQYIKPA